MSAATFVSLFKESWASYQRHNAQWLAAALAYFAAFAVAPLIIVVVEIAGFFLHNDRGVQQAIYGHMPEAGAAAVRQIVDATAGQRRGSPVAQILGWALFLLGALGLFSSLQFALNTIWDVPPKKTGLRQTLRRRVFGFAIVLAVAGLLMLTVLVNALLAVAIANLPRLFAGTAALTKAGDAVLSLIVAWLLFAAIFAYLPDRRIRARDVWLGAGLTSLLFVVGQFLLGWYLGRAGVTSAYGAFGSLVVFLLWANYSAQIALFGAEFTHAVALRNESHET